VIEDTATSTRSSTLAVRDFPPFILPHASYKERIPRRASRKLPAARGLIVDGRALWFNTEAHAWLKANGFTRFGRRWSRPDPENPPSTVRELRPGSHPPSVGAENCNPAVLEVIRAAAADSRALGNMMTANELLTAAAIVSGLVEEMKALAELPHGVPLEEVRSRAAAALETMAVPCDS
jgi:hypothetical protein